MNHYSGTYSTYSTYTVGFTVLKNGKPLSPTRSQMICNHSPDGFSWGYGGSGPAQLALAILLEELPQELATRYYQAFKWRVIASLPASWELDSAAILAAIDGILADESAPASADEWPSA